MEKRPDLHPEKNVLAGEEKRRSMLWGGG